MVDVTLDIGMVSETVPVTQGPQGLPDLRELRCQGHQRISHPHRLPLPREHGPHLAREGGAHLDGFIGCAREAGHQDSGPHLLARAQGKRNGPLGGGGHRMRFQHADQLRAPAGVVKADQGQRGVPPHHHVGIAQEREQLLMEFLALAVLTHDPGGHRAELRLSTMEVESALVKHAAMAEAAVVGRPDELTGQAVCAFVTLKQGAFDRDHLGDELRDWVAHEIGKFARPAEIRFADALPKTRSGKIMRRLLREIVTTRSVTGDVTTLEDFTVVSRLAAEEE